jgi:hypothetical protein
MDGDVGGGFGPRNIAYPEYAALLLASRKIGAAIAWHVFALSRSALCHSFWDFAPAFPMSRLWRHAWHILRSLRFP